jgi:Protein of unknown function (DUF2793)/Chaperone of endosialidase
MAVTKRLGLPLIDQGQSMKHITHNEALAQLDGIVQLTALSILSAPPANPAEDAVYIVGSSPAGLFETHEKAIALFQNGGFNFVMPRIGWRCFLQSPKSFLVFDGSSWTEVAGKQDRAPRFGINIAADDANRFAVNSNNVLLTATAVADGGAGDIRVKVNREGVSNTASILYQSNWSGRAEMGLMGDDQFRFKVSPQGSDWKEALVIDPSSAKVQCPAGVISSRIYLSQPHDTPTLGADGPLALRFQRSRGAATGVRSAVMPQDTLGAVVGCIWDGSQFIAAASISFETEIGSTPNAAASRISFNTSMPGLSAPRERIRLEPGGTLRPTYDGSVNCGSASFRWSELFAVNGVSTVSDEREKTDIEPLATGLDFIRKLKPVSYRWKVAERIIESDDHVAERPGRRRHLGLIAQEVKAALDQQAADFGLYTYDGPADRHGLRYDQLFAPIIKAIQELDGRVEDLSRRLTLIGH